MTVLREHTSKLRESDAAVLTMQKQCSTTGERRYKGL